MSDWPEVEDCISRKKQAFKLAGQALTSRLSEGQIPATLFAALSAAITSFELSESALLTEVPDEVGSLSKLIELLLTGNTLVSIPSAISKLGSLRTLLLNNNKLSTLPTSLGELSNLQTLNVAHNQLTELPDTFSSLQELSYVNASYNQLTTFPHVLTTNTKLSSLFLAHNTLASVPSSIGRLVNLTALTLDSNKLEALPLTLSECTKLKSIGLTDNPYADKKLIKVVKEGKVKSILGHIKKYGSKAVKGDEAPPSAPAAKQQPPPSYPFTLLPPEADIVVEVTPDTKGLRPHIACALLRGVAFTSTTYSAFIALQTDLHQSMCSKRMTAAIGTHDAAKISPPLTFTAKAPQDIVFVPLLRDVDVESDGSEQPGAAEVSSGATTEAGGVMAAAVRAGERVCGDQLSGFFAGDRSMLTYLKTIQEGEKWVILQDSSGELLSLPPVINSEYSRLDPSTEDILVEVTSPSKGDEGSDLVKKVLLEFLERFAKVLNANEQQLAVAPVRITSPGGHTRLLFPPRL